MTLKFRKSGRQWSNVGQVSLNGSIGLHSDIFPNVRYGFNGKLFIVSTIEAGIICIKNASLCLYSLFYSIATVPFRNVSYITFVLKVLFTSEG